MLSSDDEDARDREFHAEFAQAFEVYLRAPESQRARAKPNYLEKLRAFSSHVFQSDRRSRPASVTIRRPSEALYGLQQSSKHAKYGPVL
jgi:hypothetical protein